MPTGTGTSQAQDQGQRTDSHTSIVGPVVGGLLGGFAAAALVVSVFLFLRRRRPSSDNHPIHDGSVSPFTGEVTTFSLPPPTSTSSHGPFSDASSVMPADAPMSKKQRSMAMMSSPSETISSRVAPSVSGGSAVTSGDGEQPRLAHEDLERVLAFVSQRMDQSGPSHHPVQDAPPQYHG